MGVIASNGRNWYGGNHVFLHVIYHLNSKGCLLYTSIDAIKANPVVYPGFTCIGLVADGNVWD